MNQLSQGEPAGQAAAQQKKKGFDNMKNRPARDYDGVDPSFKVCITYTGQF